MSRRKKQRWSVGDIFSIQQRDGNGSIGQILDVMLPNVVTCAFYDLRYSGSTHPQRIQLNQDPLISCVSVSREPLDDGSWKVIAHQQPAVCRDDWPNETFRDCGWVGAKIYDARIIEEFLDAFYGLTPWDDWHDPNYLDKLLISPEKKPKHLVFKKKRVGVA